MKIEVSVGEVVDKITILQIKEKRIKDEIKLKHIKNELAILQNALFESEHTVPAHYIDELRKINSDLWDAEDILRYKENLKLYDNEFIQNAVLDSVLNDKRFLIKNKINDFCSSDIKEQKSYDIYKAN